TAKSRHRIALDLIRRKGNFSVNKDAKPTEANARKEIQLQFKEAADQIERPEQLDLRMEQMMHFQVNGSNIRVVAGLPPNLNIDPGDIGRLKQIGPEIRSQLAPGEAVFVYISDLDDRTGQKKTNYSFTRICNPLTYADRNEWKTIIRDDYEHILLPTWLPGGFSFKHGVVQSEIGCSKENKDKYYDRLKEQTVKMKQNVTWAAVEPDDFDFSHTAPAIIYSNGYGDQIKVSYRSMRDGTITTLTPDADKIYCAELDVDIYWLKYGAIWMKHRHGKTHSYTLSASPAVSRVDLEKMVSHMK
ncbi:MAG: hypothetical protein K0Q59_1422, partial [Paenibacillus sp.]|nr:hypothetical protein [Paenibacillus sp.]